MCNPNLNPIPEFKAIRNSKQNNSVSPQKSEKLRKIKLNLRNLNIYKTQLNHIFQTNNQTNTKETIFENLQFGPSIL